MSINRRQLLKRTALGSVSLAFTPSFNHLLAAPTGTSRDHPHRFIFIRKSNGNLPQQFALPSFSSDELKKHEEKQAFEIDLSKHELPEWLSTLDGYKQHMCILHGISMSVSGGGHYSYSGCMGAYKAGRDILSNIKRATIDFELAKLFPSPFGHVEMSLAVPHGRDHRTGIVSGYSAPAAKQRNYCYADPMTAYQELFKSVTNTEEVASDIALFDYLHEQENRRLKGLDGDERLKISDQIASLQSVRDRNTKVESLGDKVQQHLPEIAPIHARGGEDAGRVRADREERHVSQVQEPRVADDDRESQPHQNEQADGVDHLARVRAQVERQPQEQQNSQDEDGFARPRSNALRIRFGARGQGRFRPRTDLRPHEVEPRR